MESSVQPRVKMPASPRNLDISSTTEAVLPSQWRPHTLWGGALSWAPAAFLCSAGTYFPWKDQMFFPAGNTHQALAFQRAALLASQTCPNQTLPREVALTSNATRLFL